MKKGKLKKENKYSSIMLVPHSSSGVTTFKISALYPKLVFVSILTLMIFVCLGFFVIYTAHENYRLKHDISTLSDLNAEQKKLLDDKGDEISELKQKEALIDKMKQDFEEKYSKLADTYIANRSGGAAISRSGDRNDRSFIRDINDLKSILDNLNELSSPEDKPLTGLSEAQKDLQKYMDSIPTLWPSTGKLSSTFGGRRDPFWSRKSNHEGIDIAAPKGQPILASGSGEVTFSGYYNGYGYAIIINHGYGISTVYGHASKLVAKVGQQVKKGDLIARVGSSGRSTGPHLHFEIRINDDPIDPLKYLDN